MSKYVCFSTTCRGQCLAWARAFSAGTAAKETTQPHWPVIISGAGPVGLTMALWLSRFGVRSLVLERALEPTRHPQAHYVNNRTMEVLRPLWDLSHEMVAASPPLDHWRTFRYAFTMTGHGETLGVVDHFAGAKSAYNHAVSPEPVTHLPQHQLLPMLLARASAPHSLVTLLWGHSVTGFTPEPGRVEVVAEDPQRAQRTFHGSYLVAADGAHSTIRQQLGIPQSGQAGIQHLINIHFTSPSLGARLLQGTTRANQPCGKTKAAMLYFVFNREVVGVVVAHSLVRGEFVMQVPYLPPLQSAADFPEAKCRQLVGSASGLAPSQLMDLIIHQIRPWQMNAVVADSFQHAPPGSGGVPRVFLVGDAAHCFPPAGGLGMNTGIQDAHNLAWKLALVTKEHSNGNIGRGGSTMNTIASSSSAASSDMAASSTSSNTSSNMNSRAYVDGLTTSSAAANSGSSQVALGQAASLLPDPAHLLLTYEHERKPVAHANCALSLRNWQEAVTIPSTLGLDPRAADALNSAVNAVPLVPSAAGKALLEAGLAVGRTVTTSPWSPLRPVQLARIKAKCEAGITLRLQYPKEDLGFQYPATSPDRPTAVAPSPPLTAATNTSPQGINKPAAVLRDAPYVPSTEPGCRLPHLWLRNPTATTPSPPHSPPAPGVSHLHDSPQAPWSSEVWLHRHGYKPSSLLSTIDVVAGMPRADSMGSHQGGHTVVGPVQPHLTLFVDEAQGPHNPWLLGLATLSEQCGGPQHLPVSAVQILPTTAAAAAAATGSSTDHDDARQLAPSQADGQLQQPAVRAYVDVHGKWHSTMQLPHGSALLVRPDGHVAWRHGSLPHSSRASSTSDPAPAVQGNSTTTAAAAAAPAAAPSLHQGVDDSVQQAAKLLRDAVSMVLQGTTS